MKLKSQLASGLYLLMGSLLFSHQINASAQTTKQPKNQAFESIPLLGGRGFIQSHSFFLQRLANTYQLGSEWGKKFVTPELLDVSSAAFKRAAYATAKIGGATGFYLGEFNGKHILATNHHVCSSSKACTGGFANFVLLNKKFKVLQHLGNWKDIDLALEVIDIQNQDDVKALKAVESNFDFETSLPTGLPLVTVGFGFANNPQQKLVGNEDSDCLVFSGDDEFRYIDDPDTVNPSEYKTWSFANGCDVSHGDSGSAMVNRLTGRVLGLIWTGSIPKTPDVQNSENLTKLRQTQSQEIWEKLSFAVPAKKIQEHLGSLLEDGKFEPTTAAIISAIIK